MSTRRYRSPIPDFAETYIRKVRRRTAERVVVLFHGWLRRHGKELAHVSGADLASFARRPGDRAVSQMTRNDYRYEARRYLRWLEERGLAGPFGPQELDGYHRRPLPDEVKRFLRFLAPIRRPSTVKTYLGFLRRFHEWIATRKVAVGDVDRTLCLEWAQHLHDEGIAAATRVGMLVCVRKYVDWLWDAGLARTPGQALVRVGDLPKKAEYLPRPLPPDADRELQGRLEQDQSAPALGLLVMRRAGLRLGELRRLERDWVRRDHAGGAFLKVPLGKMNNERLVPLDAKALDTIRLLQQMASRDARWLVEGARERPMSAATYVRALARLSAGIMLPEPLTSHRLRHTFASSLMNGGMSLLGIMKLLGHREQRMTLRYTAIADATVGREYFEALTRIMERYELPDPGQATGVDLDPTALLEGAIAWITKHYGFGAGPFHHRARLLARRLEAAKDDLQKLRLEAQDRGLE